MTSTIHPSVPGALPRVLSIAGTDPSGGAGTAADMKSITAAGGYGMTVVTCLVAQNTTGVRAIHTPPTDFLAAQLKAVGDDVVVDGVKTGMLGTAAIIETVEQWLDVHQPPVLVVDPVMVATSGDRLLEPDAEAAMSRFCRRATVITPNIPELAVLVDDDPAPDQDAAVAQARAWAADTGVAVIVKTGHLDSRLATNLWVGPEGPLAEVPCIRVDTTSTHGTGCSLSSALATRLAAGDDPATALVWTTEWLHEAILHGSELVVGPGQGPVDHCHRWRRLAAAGQPVAGMTGDDVPATLVTPDQLDPTTDAPAAATPTAPEVPASAVPAAGPWTAALWRAGSDLARRIADCDLVTALVDGTLSPGIFSFYLGQDACYLAEYPRALAAVAASSTDPAEAADWAAGATASQVVEAELHRNWLGADSRPPAPSPVTRAYVDFLMARALGDDHPVGAAAVLPCYWLYAQVGASLPQVPDDHRYAGWLATYRDDAFITATATALGHVEKAMEVAAPAQRSAAARAFLISCRHELEFFEQALRMDGLR
ncbi:MAG: bifunctional hydroxymethylpyrimidine kinase/phosphomethylpyrimidine kinase [Acidipropionibacterium jensenii]|uniref:bifunctional hydroxymethylpyrimidine kinase/phosphomethylpyrimidine kinase n=1 Tax=Acidipropionibacterium jensenii TaxID=1749 RepID=UPI0026490C3D|nr:bifunctional hydroxymethylpyrimidine kinase/phosphomethylpyrimidine kinase [Acidipropionibacterium jensenii]MDN6811043.1 bifunctional hydroxymethylpyrimidine kinase/phosphomethylpyrimidine kinase [Acidipropionibacterium jensenii]